MNECGWGHRLTDFCEERSAFMHKIYYQNQQLHFGGMKGIVLFTTGWDNSKTTHLVWTCRENGPNTITKN